MLWDWSTTVGDDTKPGSWRGRRPALGPSRCLHPVEARL